jgi:RNA polymerase sigma-70 factor (ECF subfamily)
MNASYEEESAVSTEVKPFEGESSDADLCDAITAGDQQAFRALMGRYNRRLYRTARSILKNDADAEDALQNAYLLVYRGIGKFRGDAGLSTWLVRIVINEALACLRKRSRSAHVVNLESSELDAAIEAQAADMCSEKSEPLEDRLIRSDTNQLIQAKIDELPVAYRAVFVLRARDDRSVTETAAALRIPEATVRTRFFRARALLRQSLSADADATVNVACPLLEPRVPVSSLM